MELDMSPRPERRIEAARAGRTIFIRARPCPHCCSQEFYTSSNQCVPCTKQRSAANNVEIRRIYREAKARP